MGALREKVRCRKTLGLIQRCLRAGVMLPGGIRAVMPQGVPQGGPLSPLLANIAVDPLDKEWECPGGLLHSSNNFLEEENAPCMAGAERRQSRGHKFTRYADDIIVTVKSANATERLMASLIRFCEGQLQLIINREKSRAAPLKSCAF
jgi:RNA-directed DNA polymerase